MRHDIAIARAPLRVSFVGGGSDIGPGNGATVSCTINKYVYAMAKRLDDSRVIVNWREKENHERAELIKHDLIREAMLLLGIHHGVEVATFADVPGVGSGLGSSAATTVAVLLALGKLMGLELESSPATLLNYACVVELERLKRKGGSQDQLVTTYGGLVRAEYQSGQVSNYERLPMTMPILLSNHFALFMPSNSAGRNSDEVLAEKCGTGDFVYGCVKLVELWCKLYQLGSWHKLGECLYSHHSLKMQEFPNYMDREVEKRLVSCGRNWKLCGAGITGHLLVGTRPDTRHITTSRFKAAWGPERPFEFVDHGAEVIYAA